MYIYTIKAYIVNRLICKHTEIKIIVIFFILVYKMKYIGNKVLLSFYFNWFLTFFYVNYYSIALLYTIFSI